MNLKSDLDFVSMESETNLTKLVEDLQLKTSAAKTFLRYALANALLFDRKHTDYGPTNISGFGTFGVIVRMNDKHERLKTLFAKKKRRKAVNESVEDTLRDISNYAIIACIVEKGEWPA